MTSRDPGVRLTGRGPLARFASRLPSYGPLVLIVLFNLAVFGWLLLQALKPTSEFLSLKPWEFPSTWEWSNFTSAWQDAQISSYFVNSLFVSLGAPLISLAVATPAAYALARFPRTRTSTVMRQSFFVGLLMAPVVLIVPLYFELSAVRMLDTLTGLVVIYAGLSLPFTVWYLTSFFTVLPHELEEAAAIDGASVLSTFVHVFLPNVLSGLFAVFLVNFLWAWNEFFLALTFLTSEEKSTIALGVFNLQTNATYGANWPVLFAGMLIAIVPVLLLYTLLSQQITRAMAQGAVKG
jgi:ABC-type glycerol-3-phosphate transport system permease component